MNDRTNNGDFFANEPSDWFHRDHGGQVPAPNERSGRVPSGLWTKCGECDATLHVPDLERALYVCHECNHHFAFPVEQRIASLVDEGSFTEMDIDLKPTDPLEFVDSKPYPKRLSDAHRKTGRFDAYVAGPAKMDGIALQIGAFDFKFLGGSMGSVVGEKITRQIERAVDGNEPVIIVSASGGARMQEGVLSLMQMAKINAALARHRSRGLPFISILTHPTTGGVAASFATLGDVSLAEPKALIGFAGPRVIEQTIRQKLPPGFQRSEYLLDHGMVDRIVHRHHLRDEVIRILHLLLD